MKGALEHFHFLSVLASTYDDTVRNIDIGHVGYLRQKLHCRLSDRARAQDATEWCQLGRLARFTFKGLDGTMTDLFIHLVAYQLAPARRLKKARCPSTPFFGYK